MTEASVTNGSLDRACSPHAASTADPFSRADVWVAGILVLTVLITRGGWFGNPVGDFDEELYSLIGWRMQFGDLPYSDLWDRKPFGLFLIFGVAHSLLGPSPLAYQILAAGFVLAGVWLVYLLARRLVDRASAAIAGILYLMLLSVYGSYSGQSEVFHTPMMLFAVWLLRNRHRPDAARRALLAMLVAGMALQVKYTVIPQCLFLGAYALYAAHQRGMKTPRLIGLAGAYAALGLLPTLIVAAFYLLNGQFEAFWFANFVSFFDRVPSVYGRLWPGHLHGAVPILGLIGLGLYAAFRLNPPRDRRLYMFYCGWGISALATVLLPSTVYLYYYGALAPAAALIALPLIDSRGKASLLTGFALVAAFLYIVDPMGAWSRSRIEIEAYERLSSAIAPHVGPGKDCMWVHDGPSALYRTTGSCLPTRFIYPDHLNNELERDALGISQYGEVRRILGKHPPVIVTANFPVTPQNTEVLDLVRKTARRDYFPLAREEINGRIITAWARKASPSKEPQLSQ